MYFFKYILFLSLYICGYYAEGATIDLLNNSNSDGDLSIFSVNSSAIPMPELEEKNYYIPQFKLTFLEAFQFCEEIQMQLITVHSSEELDALTEYVRQTSNELVFWTSGSKLVDNRNWIWLSTMEVAEYIKWSDGQPDFIAEQCLDLWFLEMHELTFNNDDCNKKHSFICEKSKTPSVNRQFKGSSFLPDNQRIWQNPTLLQFEGKRYYIGNHFKVNFLQATQFCQIMGMELVSIDSEAENKRLYRYIRDTIAGDYFWSSGTKLVDGKSIIWSSTGRVANYTNWLPNEPNNPKEKCLQLVQKREQGLFWNDVNCDDKIFFICEHDDNDLSLKPNTIGKKTTVVSQSNANADESVAQYTDNPTLPATIMDGVKYRISKFKTAQEKASLTCKQYGMELLSVLDKKKNDAIIKLIQLHSNTTGHYWTSATKQPDGKWTWWELQPMVYTNWGANEPNNVAKSEHCLQLLYPNGQWNDVRCDREHYFICERRDFIPSSCHCNSQPTPAINIYVNNNQDNDNGSITPKNTTSKDARGYNIEINNNIGTCNIQPTVPPV